MLENGNVEVQVQEEKRSLWKRLRQSQLLRHVGPYKRFSRTGRGGGKAVSRLSGNYRTRVWLLPTDKCVIKCNSFLL